MNSRKAVINIRTGQDESMFGKGRSGWRHRQTRKGQAERISKQERHVREAGNTGRDDVI
jgi:hypothetical protein